MDAPTLFATALGVCAAMMFALWLVSLGLRDASIVDIFRGPGFALSHPHYFGGCCVWWGPYLIAAATPLGIWTILSPIAMTWLLVRVSVARTSACVPRPPRRIA